MITLFGVPLDQSDIKTSFLHFILYNVHMILFCYALLWLCWQCVWHFSDVILSTMAFQITCASIAQRFVRRRSNKKISKLGVTGVCAGNSPGTGEFPTQRASNAENISIWWRHHALIIQGCFTGVGTTIQSPCAGEITMKGAGKIHRHRTTAKHIPGLILGCAQPMRDGVTL